MRSDRADWARLAPRAHRRCLCRIVAVGIGAFVTIVEAQASNSTRPRSPPIFAAEPCLLDVDRAVDPVLRVEFDVLVEDVARGSDELDDSRTLRFFAACRPLAIDESLPPWIEMHDAVRARDAGIIDALPADEDIAERSTSWPLVVDGANGCLFPLSEAPIAIDCAGANEGVKWETSAMPAGTYEVWGYTFEPPENLWTRRPGLLVVHDGESMAPGVDVVAVERRGEGWPPTYTIAGCASAAAELSIAWIDATSAEVFDADAWTPVLATQIERGSFALPFSPPAAALDRGVFLRPIATNDAGDWTARVATPLVLLPEATGIEPTAAVGLCAEAAPASDELDATAHGCTLPARARPHATTWMLALLAVAHAARIGREPRT